MTVIEPDYVLLCQTAIEDRFDALLDEALKEGWPKEVVVGAAMELANAWFLDRSSVEDSVRNINPRKSTLAVSAGPDR